MSTELIVPTLGESITEATVSKWLKNIGDNFEADEPLVEIETDKITVEVPAPSAGSISEIKVHEGADVNIGGVLALLGDKKDQNESSTIKKPVTEKTAKVKDLTPISPFRRTNPPTNPINPLRSHPTNPLPPSV